jgi:processing peptidase subunit beta
LPNGLRVASEDTSGDTATVGVWIDTGSRYETEDVNGVAHFLEHMFFKGTKRRSRGQFEVEIENMGAILNAYTSREQTVFYAKVNKSDVPQAMDILADILQNAEYTDAYINQERNVILREMQEVEGNLSEVIFDRLHETAYRGHSLGRTILGPVENIQGITRQNIKDYITTHYVAPRMVIAGAGVDHTELVNLSTKLFGNLPSEGPTQPHTEPAYFTGSDILVRYDDLPQAHVALAFETAGWNDPDNIPLLVIQTLLGSWDSSTTGGIHSSSDLVRNIVENEAASSITAFNTQYSDTGLFGIHAIAGEHNLNDLMWCVTNAMTGLAYDVSEERLAEAKNQLTMTLLHQLDGSTTICEDIGRQVLTYGRRIHPSEFLARVEAVDKAAVTQCAKRYFYDRDFALSAIGPVLGLPDYNWIRRRTFWHRF